MLSLCLSREERLRRLRGFIEALRGEGIIAFDIGSFSHRLKLQKYVFLARRYGFDLGYVFSLYIHGPYSPDLANDYYEVTRADVPPATVELDKNFVLLVNRKSEWWLEIAATIILIKERYPNIDEEEVKMLVESAKPFASRETINKVLKELKLKKAIN